MKKEMLINVLQPEECRIAIVEDGVLEELYVERTSHESYVGNIYKGRIVNIEPSIQAAFVDFGVGRNGFLHVSDVEPAYYRHLEQRREQNGRRGGGRGRFERNDRNERNERRPQDGPARPEGPPRPRETPALDDDNLESRLPDVPIAYEALDVIAPEVEDPSPVAFGDLPDEVEEGDAERAGAAEVVSEPAVEPDEDNAKPARSGKGRGGRRRSRGRRRRRDDDAAPSAPADANTADRAPRDRPRLMDSAERRTDENETDSDVDATPDIRDEDLRFGAPEDDAEPTMLQAVLPAPDVDEIDAPDEPTEAPIDEIDDADESFTDEPYAEFDEDEELTPPRRGSSGPNRRDDRRGPRRPMGRGGRPGFLRPKPLIQDIFRRGQEVLVQVIKEGIGTKGPTLSTYISIAGRYLVLMPGLNRIGVSRKIADDEQRRRLREVLGELQPPKGLGFIIRTAGLDRNKKELQRDLAYLTRLWQVVVRRIRKVKSPAVIYEESDMITRTIRDTFTSEINTIWVDEPKAFQQAKEFLQIVMPRYANRIQSFTDPAPIFHKYRIEEEIARIQQRHVPLPSGGSLVIDQTEALVAIDVNSGNFRADNNAEETAYRMNLTAAREIARQLRLRDLGGVIVNDFIDMRDEKHRRSVERELREAVKRDRARTKILRISAFGLIEMTRQRIRPSLKRSVYQDCPHCGSTGQVKTCESMSIDVMRMLQLAAHRQNIERIQIRVHEEVAGYLLNRKRKEISQLEESGQIQVMIHGSLGVSPEFLEFNCYDNTDNEVKFLPRLEETKPRRR
jgi:ribonuclease E